MVDYGSLCQRHNWVWHGFAVGEPIHVRPVLFQTIFFSAIRNPLGSFELPKSIRPDIQADTVSFRR
jgi:hypothetical protein